MDFFWIMLQKFLGMSWTFIIVITPRRGWSIVCVGTMIVCWIDCCFQYQLAFSWMEQRYCALTTNSVSKITYRSIAVLYCIVYASERNWIVYNTFVVVSYISMAPYISGWTNKSILSLIPLITKLCISSNASKGFYFGVR